MSNKVNTAKSFAEEGLEDVLQEAQNASNATPLQDVSAQGPEEEGEMQNVGGLEPIAAYYQLEPAKKPGKTPVLVFAVNEPMKGRFERTLSREVNLKGGRKFTAFTYLIRHESDGKLYGYSGKGLRRGFERLEEGSKVIVTYTGVGRGKDGTEYANFTILGNKLKK